MKINADTQVTNLQLPTTASERKPAAGSAAAATAEASAKVVLSPAAQLASAAGAGAAADSGIDAEKVARMSQAIADGTFKVNPEAIADKLIANAREQLAKAYGKVGGNS